LRNCGCRGANQHLRQTGSTERQTERERKRGVSERDGVRRREREKEPKAGRRAGGPSQCGNWNRCNLSYSRPTHWLQARAQGPTASSPLVAAGGSKLLLRRREFSLGYVIISGTWIVGTTSVDSILIDRSNFHCLKAPKKRNSELEMEVFSVCKLEENRN